jgi:multiple sugar transport system permease protein
MEVSVKPSVGTRHISQQHIGFIMLGIGIALLAAGSILVQSTASRTASPLLKNISPLLILGAIILIGQSILVLLLKGQRLTAWFFALPTLTFILVVVVFPTLYAVIISFLQWDAQIPNQQFIFIDNYAAILRESRVVGAVWNTLRIAITSVVLECVLGVGLAMLFVDKFPGRSLILSFLILPLMLAPVIVGQTWRMLWDTRFGAVNHLLSIITGDTVQLNWLADTNLGIIAITLTDVWQWTPFVFLITLAGLMAINLELYESAAIDGATSWNIFWHVTLPILRPVLLVALLFRFLEATKIFDTLYLLTNGGPGYTTENFSFYLYQQGFNYFRFGYTSAGSILFLIVIIILSTILIRRIGET